MENKRKRPRIGDVIEIQTAKGRGYVQYVWKSDIMGPLVRVLPRVFAERPEGLDQLVNAKEMYYVHLPLGAMVARDVAAIVGNVSIPDGADRPSRAAEWARRSDGSWGFRYELTRKSERDETRGIWLDVLWNDTALAERIAEAWRPDIEEGA